MIQRSVDFCVCVPLLVASIFRSSACCAGCPILWTQQSASCIAPQYSQVLCPACTLAQCQEAALEKVVVFNVMHAMFGSGWGLDVGSTPLLITRSSAHTAGQLAPCWGTVVGQVGQQQGTCPEHVWRLNADWATNCTASCPGAGTGTEEATTAAPVGNTTFPVPGILDR